MTRQAALLRAKKIIGPTAAVQMTAYGARVGSHGEYVPSHLVSNKKDSPKEGRYKCIQCSTSEVTEGNDYIEHHVFHIAGGTQTQYKVGRISLGMFFTVMAEGDSFEACFKQIESNDKKANY